MNGYNTGWKFDRWYTAAAATTIANGTITAPDGTTPITTPTFNSANRDGENAPDGSTQRYSIMTHGYNAIRLRFACYPTSGTVSQTQGPIVWGVYLLEGTNEEDQTGTHWISTWMTNIVTNWASAAGVASGYSTTKSFLLNYQSKPWAILANTIRTTDYADGATASKAYDDAQNEAYASQYFYAALGQDVRWGASTTATDGTGSAITYTPKGNFAVYSPGFSSESGTASSSGEVYITNLAGAARIMVIPRFASYFPTVSRHPTAPLSGSGTASYERNVGVLYNLTQ
jgi:hypothetical protein